MVDSKGSLFSNPDLAVSLLVPNLESEGVSYKYLKTLAREFVLKSGNPAEFASMINAELSKETSKTRREALFHLKQRAIEVFALDEE
jgi:predicted DNA-binding protein (UPF0278 family)